MNDLPDSDLEQARMLETIMVQACEGSWSTADVPAYRQMRASFIADTTLKSLLPEFVRTCRDLSHFWQFIKAKSPKWAPRRAFVRDEFTPLIDHLEGRKTRPVDAGTGTILAKFDASAVHAAWSKALERRHADAEGAITTARTLLESVCKTILEKVDETYADTDDLPSLYKKVARSLQLAPSQHSEEVFKRILGGCTSVVEGLGTLRNKLSDAHGRTSKAAPIKPTDRHAELAVNLAGAMATFIVQTWEAREEKKG